MSCVTIALNQWRGVAIVKAQEQLEVGKTLHQLVKFGGRGFPYSKKEDFGWLVTCW